MVYWLSLGVIRIGGISEALKHRTEMRNPGHTERNNTEE
jgi:hypothetical protein